ncbi:thioredoxin family protein [Flavobacteriaceae bacterium F89]|uniref:Thioredoxin family protein n=1 Tax=Cerina litoralis TaxID=2874477 RepID=A0AAE3EVB8_9FLAO|nr:thioredoxin family protein [Cerina litoralis]MCG2460969.1 thioredoxin family protein [Cerina litoralis]
MKYFALYLCLSMSLAVYSQDWQPNYAEAVATANEENKPILLVFSGSDWCGPCMKLDRDVWSSPEFEIYATRRLVLYRADFPRKKGHRLPKALAAENGRLAESYNPNGYFPLIVLLDKKQQVLGKTGYKKMPPQDYVSLLNSFVK